MRKFQFGLRGLSLSALALACTAAFAADIDPSLVSQARRDGVVEALIVFANQATPLLAPLEVNADYKVHRRALVDALRSRAASQQADLRAWLEKRGVEYRAYWISNLVWARLSQADLAASVRPPFAAPPSFYLFLSGALRACWRAP